MTRRMVALFYLLVTFLAVAAGAQTSRKKIVKSDDDLPRFTYPVRGSASALVEADDATFNVVAAKIRPDLDNILRDYEINDKATMRDLLSARLELQMLRGEYLPAFETLISSVPSRKSLQRS
jgi:hypothetical protein